MQSDKEKLIEIISFIDGINYGKQEKDCDPVVLEIKERIKQHLKEKERTTQNESPLIPRRLGEIVSYQKDL